MKAKIFWNNVLDILDQWLGLEIGFFVGMCLGMFMVLGQTRANILWDAVLLVSSLFAIMAFMINLFEGFLATLVEVIIDAIRDKHPIRNQEKRDYNSARSIVIYHTLPKEDQERIDRLENMLWDIYQAAHPAKSKRKFSLNFGAKHND